MVVVARGSLLGRIGPVVRNLLVVPAVLRLGPRPLPNVPTTSTSSSHCSRCTPRGVPVLLAPAGTPPRPVLAVARLWMTRTDWSPSNRSGSARLRAHDPVPSRLLWARVHPALWIPKAQLILLLWPDWPWFFSVGPSRPRLSFVPHDLLLPPGVVMGRVRQCRQQTRSAECWRWCAPRAKSPLLPGAAPPNSPVHRPSRPRPTPLHPYPRRPIVSPPPSPPPGAPPRGGFVLPVAITSPTSWAADPAAAAAASAIPAAAAATGTTTMVVLAGDSRFLRTWVSTSCIVAARAPQMFSATLLPISSMEALIWSPMDSIASIEPFEASAALTVTSVRLSNDVVIASYLLVVTSLIVTTSLFWRGGCCLSAGFDIFRLQYFSEDRQTSQALIPLKEPGSDNPTNSL
ncbi:unnamed protein product [Linum trigynum]|uniref:Uncharacterized protein n=1 Tax=Linum trigynum TaxID=586398 RepID=A0AAV2GUQ7_9ROSI